MAAAAAFELALYTTGVVGIEALCLETQLVDLLNLRLSQSPPCIDDSSILIIIAFISRDCESFVEVSFFRPMEYPGNKSCL